MSQNFLLGEASAMYDIMTVGTNVTVVPCVTVGTDILVLLCVTVETDVTVVPYA